MQDILIKNGLIVTADESIRADLLISDGRIARVGEALADPNARIIDGTDKYIMPGGIDAHLKKRLPRTSSDKMRTIRLLRENLFADGP